QLGDLPFLWDVPVEQRICKLPVLPHQREHLVEQFKAALLVLLHNRKLQIGGIAVVLPQLEHLRALGADVGQPLCILHLPFPNGNIHQGEQVAHHQVVHFVINLLLQNFLGLYVLLLRNIKSCLQLLHIDPAALWQLVQQLLCLLKALPCNAVGDGHAVSSLTDILILAVEQPTVNAVNLLPVGLLLLLRDREDDHPTLEDSPYHAQQPVTVGVLPHPLHGKGKACRKALLLHLVEHFIGKGCNLLIAQVLLKAQQGVQIHPQQPCQRRQQGDIRVTAGTLPLIDRGGGHP